jgi:hypothetical protein
MSKERYNQIIDEVYNSYVNVVPYGHVVGSDSDPRRKLMVYKGETCHSSGYPILQRFTKEEFINKIKTDQEFSDKFGLKIIEDYDLVPQTECWGDVTITKPVRRYKTYLVYENRVYQFYE